MTLGNMRENGVHTLARLVYLDGSMALSDSGQ